jgi:hypothetical protein
MTSKLVTIAMAGAAALGLSSCQTWGPNWTEITGVRYNRVPINTAAVTIVLVDGQSVAPMARGLPIRIDPGKRQVTLDAAPLQAGWIMTLEYRRQTVTFDFEPCRRYWINARYESPVTGSPWAPFIDFTEPIAGCDPTAKAAPAKS